LGKILYKASCWKFKEEQKNELFAEFAFEWTMGRTDVNHWGEKQMGGEDDEEGVGSYWINYEWMIILEI
jgi:hypothetical protein